MITEQELRDYFSAKGNILTNKENVTIALRDEDIFCIEYLLEEDKTAQHRYELYDEVRGAKQFLEVFSIQVLEDLQHISKASLWKRYQEETAEVIFTNWDGNTIGFRLFQGKTMLYSLDQNHYNEVMRVMNVTEDFKGYVREELDMVGPSTSLRM